MISSITGSNSEQPTETLAASNLGNQDMFLQLLVAQVRYQDPMEPMDNQEYLAQTAQFSMVEQMTRVAEQQTELLAFQQATLASGMIGQQVTGLDEQTGESVSGVVSAVEYNFGQPRLIVDGRHVDIGSISSAGVVGDEDSPASDGADAPEDVAAAPESDSGTTSPTEGGS